MATIRRAACHVEAKRGQPSPVYDDDLPEEVETIIYCFVGCATYLW